MKDVVIALDIGGTAMKGAVVEENGNILYKESFEVNASHTTEEHKKRIKEVIEKLKSNISADYRTIGLGIDCPGVVNKETVHIGGAENVPGLYGLKFSDIGDLFNIPVQTVNDASAAALGEAKYGSGKEKNYQSILFITLGKGVGGGLCKDFDMMINDITRGVQNYGLRMMVRNLEIKPASLGNDAGVLGCAALFFRNN